MASDLKHDSMESSEAEDEAGVLVTTKTENRRLKIQRIGAYVMDGFAPLVAVIAVIVAVIAMNDSQSSRAKLIQNAANIETLSANLRATKGELEKLKTIVLQGNAVQNQLQKNQEELNKKIIQQLSKLQEKMKISPTLEQQMGQPPSIAAPLSVTTSVASPPPAVPLVTTEAVNPPLAQGQVLKQAIEKFNKK